MRILYVDIDSLRPDHLGCYGYHRATSPNIDRLAQQGMRFANCYVTDAPCLPSRTALWSDRAGIHTGVINHGGVAAEPFIEGPGGGFQSTWGRTNWMTCLREAGLRTVTVSPFGERHSAFWWYAGDSEIYNTGRCGLERADQITSRIPLIIRTPGQSPRVETGLHYHLDFPASLVRTAGAKIPDNWDGRGLDHPRDYLVVSQGAWRCQRSVRFEDYFCIRSYHDGLHGFPDVMLYDVKNDPHEQHDLAAQRPELVPRAMNALAEWHGEMMRTASHPQDPMWTVLREGGPVHTRGQLPAYLKRLRETGRADWAERLARQHPRECQP